MEGRLVRSSKDGFAEAQATLEKLRKRCHSAQKSLARFEQKDVPAYNSWLQARFGEQLQELRSLEEEAGKVRDTVNRVRDLQFFTGLDVGECYRRQKYWQEHDDAPDPFREDFWDIVEGKAPKEKVEAEEPEAEWEGFEEYSEEDLMEEAFREIAGMMGIDPDSDEMRAQFEAFKRMQGGHGAQSVASARKPRRNGEESADVKKKYRQLARQLHPDHRDEKAEAREGELDQLWHQAQEAYTRGDLEALQQIEAMIETEIRGISESTTEEALERAIEAIREKLRPVERDVRQARKSPAWMFSKRPERQSELEEELEDSLELAIENLVDEIDWMEEMLGMWEMEVV